MDLLVSWRNHEETESETQKKSLPGSRERLGKHLSCQGVSKLSRTLAHDLLHNLEGLFFFPDDLFLYGAANELVVS